MVLVRTSLSLNQFIEYASIRDCRIFGAYRLEFSSSMRQVFGLGGLFCQLNGPEQESLVTMI